MRGNFSLLPWRGMEPRCKHKALYTHMYIFNQGRESPEASLEASWHKGTLCSGHWIPVLERSSRERKGNWYIWGALCMANTLPKASLTFTANLQGLQHKCDLGWPAGDKSNSNPYLSGPQIQSFPTRPEVGKLQIQPTTFVLYYLWFNPSFYIF